MTPPTILLIGIGILIALDFIVTIYTFKITEEEIGKLKAKSELEEGFAIKTRLINADKINLLEENLGIRRDEILRNYNAIARLEEKLKPLCVKPKKAKRLEKESSEANSGDKCTPK
jgi:hypothetical protein